MSYTEHYAPIELNEHEQVVLAIDGRIFPNLPEFIIYLIVFPLVAFPAFFFVALLTIHRLFRPVSYVITTERVLVVEPGGMIDAIRLDQISKIKRKYTSLRVFGADRRLRLSRLPDARFFETVIWKVIAKVNEVDKR